MKFNSVFFFCVLLCSILVSLSCSESKNAQLDRKLLDSYSQAAEAIGKRQCSEQNLSETDCAKLKEFLVDYMRKGMKENIRRQDEDCKKSSLFEEQCLERKQQILQRSLQELTDKSYIK
jgi:Na+-transporting NADH:ubiquinone oxidoreductase subunit NqrC